MQNNIKIKIAALLAPGQAGMSSGVDDPVQVIKLFSLSIPTCFHQFVSCLLVCWFVLVLAVYLLFSKNLSQEAILMHIHTCTYRIDRTERLSRSHSVCRAVVCCVHAHIVCVCAYVCICAYVCLHIYGQNQTPDPMKANTLSLCNPSLKDHGVLTNIV